MRILLHARSTHINLRTRFADKPGTNEVRLVADVTPDLMDRAAFFVQLGDLLLETKASLVELL
jgi:hypothetical protein